MTEYTVYDYESASEEEEGSETADDRQGTRLRGRGGSNDETDGCQGTRPRGRSRSPRSLLRELMPIIEIDSEDSMAESSSEVIFTEAILQEADAMADSESSQATQRNNLTNTEILNSVTPATRAIHLPLADSDSDTSWSGDVYSDTSPCRGRCGIFRRGAPDNRCPNICRLEEGHFGCCECLESDSHWPPEGEVEALDRLLDERVGLVGHQDTRPCGYNQDAYSTSSEEAKETLGELCGRELAHRYEALAQCLCHICFFTRCNQHVSDTFHHENQRYINYRTSWQNYDHDLWDMIDSMDAVLYSILRMAGVWQAPFLLQFEGKLVVIRMWDEHGHIKPRTSWWLRLYSATDYEMFQPKPHNQRWLTRLNLWKCFAMAAQRVSGHSPLRLRPLT